ncbi:anaphase promoting complex subunit 10 [Neocallimastix lanati (nom. inval.)]|uniref:Anaphase-promoting complex subunit 10 n=1 Tax=Neocallimastix californiae TaxID=1754190 RepID=A0A1Y2DZG5_9FUNG|nr:anaphase promoting complex subunit 10 [Neocallimastix sp. JGI-2020a]ORY64663.1 anaphase promoting complex subunit 10 [Neocallimastix californiae]|eukprot:ORY64663.1 anaphase promoting complex subunit 10 [Neocallimastix californiae]
MDIDVIDAIEFESNKNLREVGSLATWSLSTYKIGYGIEQLRDDNGDTYWQSDGPQPHLINIQYNRKMNISHIALLLDYKQDESYTPNKISLRAGTSFQDLQELQLFDLEEPQGWLYIKLYDNNKPLRTHLIQIAIISNHQNGKDTHVRQVKIYTEREPLYHDKDLLPFSSLEFEMYSTIL